MATFPTNTELEAAVVAHPDEDTPRLAYADWLDENGDPDRAEFIRVQCRLADLSPADPDWADLTERQDELVARLKPRHLGDALDADGFSFDHGLIGPREEPFRRGFPYFIDCHRRESDWTPDETARVVAGLTRLVRTTTIRGFHPHQTPPDQLADLLAAPAAAELTGLAVHATRTTDDWKEESAALCRLIATSPAVRRVRQLFFYGHIYQDGVAALAEAESFGSVRRLATYALRASETELRKLTGADWFGRLRHFRGHFADEIARAMLDGLGRLPELHTLDVPIMFRAVRELAAGRFPALARLVYGGDADREAAELLAGAEFPSLAVFEASRRIGDDALLELLKADWFGRLRVLNLTRNDLGDRAVAALVGHPVAKHLRVLRLGDNAFGTGGLSALAKPGAFPELTTLDLGAPPEREQTIRDFWPAPRRGEADAADVAAFVSALRLPRLRHLDLRGWPLGDAGAEALAASPAFAGLTRLDLSECGIGDPGAEALFASPHLQNLVELQLEENAVTTAADALADPAVLPRLGECRLSGNTIPPKSAEAIRRREGLYAIV